MSDVNADITGRLNWLRAGVLGANDGVVSVAALVVGFESATHVLNTILLAGLAALLGGAISMALGEYVSVSSQRDSQLALQDRETLASPWHAAFASAVAFLIGGLLPVFGIFLPSFIRTPGTIALVFVALIVTGVISAKLGGASKLRATLRIIVGGLIALGSTYLLGSLLRMHGF